MSERDRLAHLERIEEAAWAAYRYHCLGYGRDSNFDADVMLDLMNVLGRALET
jgi:hypothetical protein